MATVFITIQPINDPPDATGDSYSVNEGGTLTVGAPGLLANDTDVDGPNLTAVIASQPNYGSLTINTDGSFSYEHDGSEATSDTFTSR